MRVSDLAPVTLAILSFTPIVAAAQAHEVVFASPPRRMIEQLEGECFGQTWWVATPSDLYLLRVGHVGSRGLTDLTDVHGGTAPGFLEWEQIARIDRRTSSRPTASFLGATAGAIALGYVGATTGEGSYNVGLTTFVGISTGALAGGWAVGLWADSRARLRTIYVGAPVLPSGETVEPQAIVSSEDVERTIAGAEAGRMLRVRGTIGSFVGRVTSIGSDGLSGLVSDAALDIRSPLPAEPLSWSQITSVEHRGHRTARGAWIGGLVVGGLSAVVTGVFIGATSQPLHTADRDREAYTAAVIAGGYGGAVGAIVGAAIGSSFECWRSDYQAPVVAPSLSR